MPEDNFAREGVTELRQEIKGIYTELQGINKILSRLAVIEESRTQLIAEIKEQRAGLEMLRTELHKVQLAMATSSGQVKANTDVSTWLRHAAALIVAAGVGAALSGMVAGVFH